MSLPPRYFRYYAPPLLAFTDLIPGAFWALARKGWRWLADRVSSKRQFDRFFEEDKKGGDVPRSPGAPLRADLRIVPFYKPGRLEELEELESWSEEDADGRVRLRLYTAPGGFGKTRLLWEFWERQRANKWQGGFLREGLVEKEEQADPLFGRAKKSLLVVLDYAESRGAEIEAVIAAALKSRRQKVRVVLLARAKGDWWEKLHSAPGEVGEFFQSLAVSERRLEPLAMDHEVRQEIFEAAGQAFAKHLGYLPPSDMGRLGEHEDFERVLLVHAAALARVEGDSVAVPGLLDWLLRREKRGINRVREAEGLTSEMDGPLVDGALLLTLAGGANSKEDAVEIIQRAPSIADQPRARQNQLAEILHVLYRGRRWCDGVEPDLVGEHLVARELEGSPGLLAAAFGDGVPDEQLRQGLTVLNRLAQREPERGRQLLAEAFDAYLERLALPAVQVAIEGGDPIGQVLAEGLGEEMDPELARALLPQMPCLTLALREVGTLVTGRLKRELSKRTCDLDGEETERLAKLANDESTFLSELGSPELALEAIEESVALYRVLYASRPEAFGADLALSLSNLSNRLSDLGRRERALSAIEESVVLYRVLHASRPEAFETVLASSLNNLSNRLSDVDRRESALVAIEESVGLYRVLFASRPDAFGADLAMSLNNLALRFSALGRWETALEAIEESVGLYRALCASHPETFRADLAMSLNNLSNRLLAVGRRESALESVEESVTLYRALYTLRPEAFGEELARSLNNLSNCLSDVGRVEESLSAIEESVVLKRALHASRPEAFGADLAGSLNNLSSRLSEVGSVEEALSAIEESVGLYRALHASRPEAFGAELAGSLSVLHDRLLENDRPEEAFEAAQEALDLLEPFFHRLPAAHADWMGWILTDYESTAQTIGHAVDQERVHSLRKLLDSL